VNCPPRILIIKPSALGDVATALPLLADVRAAMPGAKVDWLVHPAFVALLEGHAGVSEIIPFDRKKLAHWWWKPSAFGAFTELMLALRAGKYDVVIDAQGLFRSAVLARITGAKVRVGFANAREGATWMYTQRVSLPDNGKQMVAVDRMRALASALGADVSLPAVFDVPIDADALRSVDAKLQESRLPREYVVVIPGARWDTKRWPAERYAETVRQVVEATRGVVLLGSPDERTLCVDLEIRVRDLGVPMQRVLNLAGRTSLKELIAWMSRAEVVVGNDSGPLHIAVALGKRVVGIYGPTSELFVGPYGQLENVVRHDVECHPCRRKTCGHHSCMQGVTVEVVWEKVREKIRNSKTEIRNAGQGDKVKG
jgi:heptosyltransferase I